MTEGNLKTYRNFNSIYFFAFAGMGALFPLLSVYLESLGLNGKQIGILASIGPIVAILAQPLWGMIVDRYQIPKKILLLCMISITIIALFFPQYSSFWSVFFLLLILNLFQSPIGPVLDNLALNFVQATRINYGNIRLWGSVGFAVAAYLSGLSAGWIGHNAIFYIFSISLFISIFFALFIPAEGRSVGVKLSSGMKSLFKLPHYALFLLSTFFIFGTMNSNNFYFGIYYQQAGGTLAGIGLVILLSASSEAPIMRYGGRMLTRFGLENTLIFAASISLLRWMLYSLSLSPGIIIILFFLQGISIGLFLIAAPQFVRQYTPKEVQVTALAIYASFGNGLGTMFCNFLSGIIYDYFSIVTIYYFFGILTLLGIVPLLWIKRLIRNEQEVKSISIH